ncbi:MAG: urea ABC transporter permease subunit UrtC [Deltaproteobacteria bacterium]|nr:urea ABC transporter permease subunit UrtC [Deltaproteobacteria bacterium]
MERRFHMKGLSFMILAGILLILFPLIFSDFRLNMAGKYLTFAFVAVGLVLCWGRTGILSLGQGIFFGLGGYFMAMFLKLESSGASLPDFMDWNSVEVLPWFWVPFHNLAFAIFMILVLPATLAFLLGWAMFRNRVGGVYFSIVTMALVSILSILIIGQQGYTGGINGITNFSTLGGWSLDTPQAKMILYYVNAVLLLGAILLSEWIINSRLGKLLLAIRDKEDRVMFSGYNVPLFKAFIFAVAGGLSAIGGAMFTLQVGLISPSFVSVPASIEMIIFATVGGRYSVTGAVYGTLLVSFAKSYLSESFPELWTYFIGSLFVGVVMLFPTGLAGVMGPLLRSRELKVPKLKVPRTAEAGANS